MPLAAIGSSALFTIFLWWFSTGIILWLNRRPRDTRPWIFGGASVIALMALGLVIRTMKTATVDSALIAFGCAIALWGWHEFSFLVGYVTGPRAAPCPPNVTGWRRFKLAAATLIYHEIALAATAGALVAITWGQPNPLAGWTFLTLAVSRLGAKLNLFLGVPNFTDDFFPDHLRHLSSYLRKGPVTLFLQLSLAALFLVAAFELWRATGPDATPFQTISFSLLSALTGLALVEHVFMIMPFADSALWRWAMPASEKKSSPVPVDL